MRKLWALGGFVAAALAYANTFRNPFVYDDLRMVVEEPSIRHLGDLPLVLSYASRFRPLVSLSYALDYARSGLDPHGYHVTNLLLHGVNVLLLALLVAALVRDQAARRGRPQPGSLPIAAVLLFAVHPLHTQAVGYVAARSELLCTTFALSALLCARRALAGPSLGWAVPAGLAFVLALASKETALALPLVFFLYDRWLAGGSPEQRRRRLLRLYAPMLALLLGLAAWRLSSYLGQEETRVASPLYTLLTQAGVLWRYVGLWLAPVSQSLMHDVTPVDRAGDPLALGALSAIALSIVAIVRFRRRAPLACFGAAWFLVLLAPSSSVVRLAEPMSEHRAYLPGIGLFVLVAAALAALEGRRVRIAAAAWVVAASAVLGAATVARNRVWHDQIGLWRDAVAKAPRLWAPRFALATELGKIGRCDLAVPELAIAIDLDPRDPRAFMNLGICLGVLGQTAAAEQAFSRVLERDPKSAKALENLGVLRLQTRRIAEARASFERALVLDPDNVSARRQLIRLLVLLEEPDQLERLCTDLRRLAPLEPPPPGCVKR